LRFQLRFLVPFVAAFGILLGWTAALGQTVPAKTESAPQDIVEQLAPLGVPPASLALKPAERAGVIRSLVAAKSGSDCRRTQLIDYLLALLGYQYERNRNELLQVWHGCVVNDFDHGCGEDTADLLMRLYERGHKEILRPLLAGYRYSDGALAEGLGTFYSEQLERNPQDFVSALAAFFPKQQRNICRMAGETDGGGMGSETEHKVLASLKAIGGEIATRCARGVRAGNQDADSANSDLPAEPQKK